MLAAFITALAGLELDRRTETAVLGRTPLRHHPVRPQRGGPRAGAPPERGRARRRGPRHPRADRPGGRARAAAAGRRTGASCPRAAAYGRLYADDPAEACRAARLAAQLTAADLRAAGINTNCVPVLDVPAPGSHDIIGDRAYGADPEQVAALGRAVAEGHMAGGVLPVIKHVPGHGRATADSHLELPVVSASRAELERIDFATFRALRRPARRHDRPRRLRGHRPGAAGQHLGAGDRRGRSAAPSASTGCS